MTITRIIGTIIDALLWLVFLFAFVLFLIGIYNTVQRERAERIEPVEAVQQHQVEATVEEPDLVYLNCVVIENDDTTRSEPTYSEAELDVLALVIYQEAGSEACSDETRMMVGNVVLNRVGAPSFPDTIEGVLLQERQYGMLHWTGLVWPERAHHLSEAHAVQRAYDCAERLLNGERVLPDNVVWQAEFIQGEIVAHQDGFYFCR